MAQPQPASQTKSLGLGSRIEPLDGIRGFGIILVMSAHVLQDTLGKSVGTFGLESFFVLSGFLITSLLLQEQQRKGSVDLRAFYWRRTQRIFPVYYTFLAIMGIVSLLGFIHIDPRTFAYDVFYIRNYSFGVPGDWWTGHSWSLAVEEQFYLIWPALLVFGGLRLGWGFALVGIVASPFLRLAVYHWLPEYRAYIDIMLPTHGDTLMFGCALGIMFVKGSRVLEWFTQRRTAMLLGILTIALIVGVLLELRYRGAYRFSIGITLQGITATTLVLYLVKFSGTRTSRFFSSRALRELGRRSYSIYLWQQPFLTPHLNHTIFGRFPFNVITAVAMGFLSYYLVERHYYAKRKPVVAAAPAGEPRAIGMPLGGAAHAPDGALEPG